MLSELNVINIWKRRSMLRAEQKNSVNRTWVEGGSRNLIIVGRTILGHVLYRYIRSLVLQIFEIRWISQWKRWKRA